MSQRVLCFGALLAVLFVTGATAEPTATTDYRGGGEATQRAREFGIDYGAMYTAAWNHKEALQAFLALASSNIFDAASSDDYCDDLCLLLRRHGDRDFALALASFSKSACIRIRDDLEYGEPKYEQAFPVTGGLAQLTDKTYTVAKGDTLERIARKFYPNSYRSAVDKIAALNHLQSTEFIREGITLTLP